MSIWDSTSKDFANQKEYLCSIKDYQNYLDGIKQTLEFMSSYSFLQFGRDTVITKLSSILSPAPILDSAIKTLHSVLLCGEYGKFSDASVLIRKYRDDLFFYLYIISIAESCNLLDENPPTEHEENIKKWQQNKLSNLNISEIMKYIASRPELKNAVKKYNFQLVFNKISTELNNYVHGNGVKYYNQHPSSYDEKSIRTFADYSNNHINYITITFVFLLSLIKPISMMSTDYVDSLDFNESPPEGSQYWVAPFVNEYIQGYISLLGNDCINYLRDNT